jgi:hypothetical protein
MLESSTKLWQDYLLGGERRIDRMEYEKPEISDVGVAGQLIQALYGPYYDGGGYTYSQGAICSSLEQE